MSLFFEVLVLGILVGGIYAMLSTGLTLVFGVMRIINFAFGDMIVFGMYASLLFHSYFDVDPYVAALVVAPVFFLGGMILYAVFLLPLAKRRDAANSQTIVTLGISLIALNLLVLRVGSTNRMLAAGVTTDSIRVGPIYIRTAYLIGCGVAVLATVLLSLWLQRSRSGKAVRAIAQDRVAAELLGISPRWSEMLTFGVGTALAGIAGVVMIPFYAVTPQADIPLALIAYIVIVLGGLGSIPGAIVGGVTIGVIESLTSFYINNELSAAFYLILFVIVLLVRPNGIIGSNAWRAHAE